MRATKTNGLAMECFVSEPQTDDWTLPVNEEDNWQQLSISFNLPDLKMPVAIVTGGNKGIGLGVVSIKGPINRSNLQQHLFNICSTFVQYLFNICSIFVQ